MGRTMRIPRLCAVAAMLPSCEAPDAMVNAAGESLLCDLPVVDAPPRAPVDPCRDGALVLEHRFERSRGAPEDEAVAFSVSRTEPVCVTIASSGEGRRRVTAATVRIDDRVVAGPGRFDQQTSTIEERLFLEAGEHVLGARVASSPGTFLDVEIRAGGDDLSTPTATVTSSSCWRSSAVPSRIRRIRACIASTR